MAIYHMHAQVISRSAGRSAVAAAAYRSGSKLLSERDGLVHDYTHKQGIAYSEIMLPDAAPKRWLDRSTLWNEVERVEKSANAQLAREFNYALPVELSRDEQIALAREYASYFTGQGMVADFSLHDLGDSNPHVHMMLTMRPCDENGFLPKSENLYLVRNLEGVEKEVNASDFKEIKDQGFEKVYKYRLGKETRQLTPSQAAKWDGCKRLSKTPIQDSHYLAPWLDYKNENLITEWREQLSKLQNRFLAKAGHSSRVDHRSYEEQGIERIAQLHEGPHVKAIEQKAQAIAQREGVEYSPVTDIRRENLEVLRANSAFEKAREVVQTLTEQIKGFGGGISDAARNLAHTIAQEMAEWKERTIKTARRLFQHRTPATARQIERTRSLYKALDTDRLRIYQRDLLNPRKRYGFLNERQKSFLTPEQLRIYEKQKEEEEKVASVEKVRSRKQSSYNQHRQQLSIQHDRGEMSR